MAGLRIRLVAALLGVSAGLGASEFFVSPAGSPSGNGSIGSPWDLQTAFYQPSSVVHPGDTIWLRGGTYSGSFSSGLVGTSANPIIIRQYPGERATIDGASSATTTLWINGSYTWFWGFEVTNSNPTRPLVAFSRPPGLTVKAPNTRFINMIVHDTGEGFGWWMEASDSEISGCLIYYNGNHHLDHGIYTQNQNGGKLVADSIIFNNYGHGIQAYGSDNAFLNNYTFQGVTFFNNGLLSTGTSQRNLLVGGSNPANNPKILDNMIYQVGPGDTDFDMGYVGGGCTNATVTANYVTNTEFTNCSPVSMTGNTFYGGISGFTQSQYPDNTYDQTPNGTAVFVRPNAYEAGRANITIYNWGLASSVSVDLSSVVSLGGGYEIRHAMDYFGPPVASGTYAGGTVSIPMTGLVASQPVGFAAPAAPGPKFGAFVLTSTLGPGQFFDVPSVNPFHDAVTRIANNGITAGCAPGYFCPDGLVTRAQMAVFLLKSEHGSAYTPPAATGTVFADVPANGFAAAWIEQLAAEAVTGGCGAGGYCPGAPVSRAQMAVFLLKTKMGSAYAPPPATGTVFADVPASGFAAAWIEDLAARGITGGCGGGNYCPNATVTRGQMAALLVNTFDLP